MKKISVIFNESNEFCIKILKRRNINIINVKDNIFTIYKNDLDKIPKIYIKEIKYIGLDRFNEVFNNYKYFFIIITVSFILMIILSHMIFKIEIRHDNKEIREIIKDELEENGVNTLSFRKSYKELDRIKKKIKKDYNDKIDWIDIERRGVIYIVKVEERIITKVKKAPLLCDLISTKDANIISYNVSHGETIKDLGDFVAKGETIVSGTIRFNDNIVSHTCANGEVYGNTWYKVNVNIPFKQYVKTMTTKRSFNIGIQKGSKYSRVFKIHFKHYDSSKYKLFKIGKVKIYFETVNEYKFKKIAYTKEKALDAASKKAQASLKTRINPGGDILSEKVLQSDVYDSIMYIEFFYSVSEPIGRQVVREIPQKGEKEDEATG